MQFSLEIRLKMNRILGAKKAQITIFVVLAILIVAGVSIVLLLKYAAPVPTKIQPVEDYFLKCVNDLTLQGAMALGEQGGYIDIPAYEIGSDYAPSGSQMNFFGSVIPYWFYVSGNNIKKTQVPSLNGMEEQLASYIKDNIGECTFEGFADYKVIADDEADVKTSMSDNGISVTVSYPLTISYQDITKKLSKHSVNVKTNLGSLFKTAKSIFDAEQSRLFLENYAIDTITLNAPTTGTEVTCVPKTWNALNISENVLNSLQANIQSIKIKGDYYKLAEKENKYFVQELGKDVNEQINFIYSPLFPTKFEVSPEENGLMIASPVGMQEGLGVLGFCYVPYHFVYSLSFPVLIQVMDESGNMFQFSTIVIVDKNKAREAVIEEDVPGMENEMCDDSRKIELVSVFTHDAQQNPVESKISFKCLSTTCDIGYTDIEENEALLTEKFPQCVNGFVMASADGYATAKQEVSTNEPTLADLTLYPYHELEINLGDIGEALIGEERVLLTFSSDDYSTSIVYPSQKTIKLIDGVYDVKAMLFKKGDIKFEAETKQECVKMPVQGIGALLGIEKEECYDIEVPAQSLTEIIAGGGNTITSFTDSELESSSEILISLTEFNVPKDIFELQNTYALIDSSPIEIDLI